MRQVVNIFRLLIYILKIYTLWVYSFIFKFFLKILFSPVLLISNLIMYYFIILKKFAAIFFTFLLIFLILFYHIIWWLNFLFYKKILIKFMCNKFLIKCLKRFRFLFYFFISNYIAVLIFINVLIDIIIFIFKYWCNILFNCYKLIVNFFSKKIFISIFNFILKTVVIIFKFIFNKIVIKICAFFWKKFYYSKLYDFSITILKIIIIIKNYFLTPQELFVIILLNISKIYGLTFKESILVVKAGFLKWFNKWWIPFKAFFYKHIFYNIWLELYFLLLHVTEVERYVSSYIDARKDYYIKDWKETFIKWKWARIDAKHEFFYIIKNLKKIIKHYFKHFKILIFFYVKKISFLYLFMLNLFIRRSFFNGFLFAVFLLLLIKFFKILLIFLVLNGLKFKVLNVPIYVLFNFFRKFKRRILLSFRHVYLRIFRHFTLKWLVFYSSKYRKFFVDCEFRFRYKRLMRGELFIHYSLWDKWKNPWTDNWIFKLARRWYKWWYKKYKKYKMSIKIRKKLDFYRFFGLYIYAIRKVSGKILNPVFKVIIVITHVLFMFIKWIVNCIRNWF